MYFFKEYLRWNDFTHLVISNEYKCYNYEEGFIYAIGDNIYAIMPE